MTQPSFDHQEGSADTLYQHDSRRTQDDQIGHRVIYLGNVLTAHRTSVVGYLIWMFLSVVPASAEVRIDGVDGDIEAVVRTFLSIDELPCDAPRWWVEHRVKQARPEIRRAMEALGFYNPEVTTTLDRSDACWTLGVAITPGEQVRVRSFDLEIDEPLANEPLVTELRTGKGLVLDVPFSHEAYEGLKEQLLDTAQDLGYFDAEFSRHQVRTTGSVFQTRLWRETDWLPDTDPIRPPNVEELGEVAAAEQPPLEPEPVIEPGGDESTCTLDPDAELAEGEEDDSVNGWLVTGLSILAGVAAFILTGGRRLP